MNVIVLIPSYKGDEKLLNTIASLQEEGFDRFVIVNDGSAPEYDIYYEKAKEMGCDVLRHAMNLGKGRGMRTGFNHILLNYPDAAGVVTCDADGQHPGASVKRAAQLVEKYPNSLILGCREFFKAKVPLPNLLGNTITRAFFFLLNGLKFKDTQCGLRGFPIKVVKQLMECYGERFEFENTMLLELRKQQISYVQFPMAAVYEQEGKQATHYNRLLDSYKIYSTLLRYAAAPIAAGLLSTLIAFIAKGFSLQEICHAMAVMAGWLFLSISMPDKGITRWLISTLICTVTALVVSFVLLAFEKFTIMQVWWLGAIVQIPLGYSLWNWSRFGKKPSRYDVSAKLEETEEAE